MELVKRLQPIDLDLVEVFAAGADWLDSEAARSFTDDFEVAFISNATAGQRLQAHGRDGFRAM